MVNVTLAIQYYKESNKHTQKLINVKRIESKASTFHKVPASKEGVNHNGCGQVNKEWRRSRILPGVGYLLESDITHDPIIIWLLSLSSLSKEYTSSFQSY